LGAAAVILAAGEGTRMKSDLPKVLHRISGRPMIAYVSDAVREAGIRRLLVVVGKKSKEMTDWLPGAQVVVQEEQLGTGHALRKSVPYLRDFKGALLVLCGDTPLISPGTLKALTRQHTRTGAAATILTALMLDPTGYGRIVRAGDSVERIVEEKDASPEERRIREINTGTYCFNKETLFSSLPKIRRENSQKEFYLTDIIEILKAGGHKVASYQVAEEDEIMGVNTRKELADAERMMRLRIVGKWMAKGVTFIDPNSTFVGGEVKIGKDTNVYPYTFLEGKTTIGSRCTIGPSVRLVDSRVGNGVEIQYAVIRESVVEDGASLGPFCSLRGGTRIRKGSKVGSFVEIKKSEVGEGSKVPHLSYVGDTLIGKNVNVGAGAVTCNYDGIKKNRTIIEDDVFVGSDTMLVAPVRVGKGAVTGAGSVITKNVPAYGLGLERSEQKNIEGWAKKKQDRKKCK
jgi:bifunctional UDP-N-acetylglucosamine pyrophosphorylase/glucosamine-1-phosphate N-acetyltransferase